MSAVRCVDTGQSAGQAAPRPHGPEALTVEQLSPKDGPTNAEWDRFALESPDGTIYHLTAWRTILAEVFGHETYYLWARDGAGAMRGILPLVPQRTRLFGDYMVSVPVANYGGPCASDEAAETFLVKAAADLAQELGVAHVELRTSREHSLELPVRTDKVSMRLPLPRTAEALWSATGPKVRAQ